MKKKTCFTLLTQVQRKSPHWVVVQSLDRPNRRQPISLSLNHWHKCETGPFSLEITSPPQKMSPFATYYPRKWSVRFWREINVYGRWMKDGGATGNTGPTQNNRIDLGACLRSSCFCGAQLNEFTLVQNNFRNTWDCHSPFLDQKDRHQHKQYKDEDTGADPSDLHHPICLFSWIRDDFWLLCGTY